MATVACNYPNCDLFTPDWGKLCSAHAWRLRHDRDMDEPVRRLPRSASVESRLLARRLITPLGCWEFQGARRSPKGTRADDVGNYARMWDGKKSEYVHRLSYRLFVGDIPSAMLALHSCDNPPCFNPAHLRLGNKHENAVDSINRGRHYTPMRKSQ